MVAFVFGLDRDSSAESYFEAVATNQPFECEYELDSFFGGTEPFKAQIRGKSFRAVSATVDYERSNLPFDELSKRATFHYWRLGDTAYLLQTDEPHAMQVDLAAIARAWGAPVSELTGNIFFFPLPPRNAICRRIASQPPLDLPSGVSFVDMTQSLIAEMPEHLKKER
jgi:hypothetical protein